MGLKDEVNAIRHEVKEVRAESFATEILKDYKKQNKRQFIVILVILFMWFITGCYLVYVLNDIGVVETTETKTQEITQENDNGNNNFIGNDGNITYGQAKD